MVQNSPDFSEAMRLAKTPAGQELLAAIQAADPSLLKRALEQYSSGDQAAAEATIRQALKNKGGNFHG